VRDAFEHHVAPNFRHHNPFFRGDAASLMAAMEQNAAASPGKVLDVRHALQEGDRVAVFSSIRQKPSDARAAVVHLFRFEGNRIAELWDIGQAAPSNPVNEHPML
jgi:predicted SnoaL-like aldol condensation-catalyzing enzyme